MGEIIPAFVSFDRHLLESGVSESHIIEIAFDYYEYQKYRDPEVLYPYFKKKLLMYMSQEAMLNFFPKISLTSFADGMMSCI